MKRNGQSTVEYLVLLAAVIVVCIVFLRRGGKMYVAVEDTLNGSFYLINRLEAETTVLP